MIISIDVGEKNFAYCIGDLDKVYSWKCHDVKMKKTQTVIESCMLISKILESEKELIDQCSDVVIEQQMLVNIRAQRVAQHVWSWCKAKYPDKVVTFFPSYRKTQYFLGKNNLGPRERKKWSIEKVCSMLDSRDDETRAMYDAVVGKKDDICDAFLQMTVYLLRN